MEKVLPVEQTDPEFAEALKWYCNSEERKEGKINVRTVSMVQTKEVGRNDPCPCGSGKKYKKCCLN